MPGLRQRQGASAPAARPARRRGQDRRPAPAPGPGPLAGTLGTAAAATGRHHRRLHDRRTPAGPPGGHRRAAADDRRPYGGTMGPAVTAVAAAVPAASVDPWPLGDTLILRRRPVRAGTPAGRMSRFADPAWVLQPAHPDAHHTVNSLHWGKWPHELVREFKAVALAALDHPYPAAEAVASGCDQPAIDTVSLKMRDLRIFAAWMHDNGLTSLSRVTARHLDAYLASVLALTASDDRKAHLLHSVRLIWVFRRHLPEDCRMPAGEPWDGASGRSLPAAPRYSRENRTPRIAPDTMEPLLAWSLRMLEVLGPDIRDAWTEYRQILHGEHPWQEGLAELAVSQRLEAFLARARRENIAIPGRGAPAEAAQPVLAVVRGEHLRARPRLRGVRARRWRVVLAGGRRRADRDHRVVP